MATIWKGGIDFGLVHIPVSLQSAVNTRELSFKQLDSHDLSPIHYKRVSEKTGREVAWADIVKGYEYSDDHFVVLNDEDFEQALVESTQSIELQTFVKREEIEIAFFDRPYFLVPEKGGSKGYVLLREALKRTDLIGIARVVIRTREYVAALIPEGRAVMMVTLRYASELRHADDFKIDDDVQVTEKESSMAERLVREMSAKWEPEKFSDRYTEALKEIIEEKAKGTRHEVRKHPERTASNVVDIGELLKRSLQKRPSAGSGRKAKSRKSAPKSGKTAGGGSSRKAG